MKANSTIVFLVFLAMTLFITEVAFAYSREPVVSPVDYGYTQPRQVVHTVQEERKPLADCQTV